MQASYPYQIPLIITQMKYVLLIALVLILGTIGTMLLDTDKSLPESPPSAVTTEAEQAITEPATEDSHYALMQAEYAKLEKARRNLEKRLARLKAMTWGVKLPTDQAENITKEMKKGYQLLKYQKRLGAFSGLSSIQDELARVEFRYQSLASVVEAIKRAKSNPANSNNEFSH